jgi:hypothetical protein
VRLIVKTCSHDALQRLTEADFDELSQLVLEKYRDDGVGLVEKRYEQRRVNSWDWLCIRTTMQGYRVLDDLDEELATFLIDYLLELWKHAQRYWEIHDSLMFVFVAIGNYSIWRGRELVMIETLASAFLRIRKAESCNMFHRLCVLALIIHLLR